MKTIEPVDILIPTYNNPELLSQCISSIASMRLAYPIRVIVINNGHPKSLDFIPDYDYLKIIQTGGTNLGWEGGLKEGLKHSKSEFVCFMNDDAYVTPSEYTWLRKLMGVFMHKEVAATGPSSNCVMGSQNIWKAYTSLMLEVTYLIGFCKVLRRSALDEVGGIDDTLPGGDDLDISIRLRKAGYKLIANRTVFVYHHGFVTGTQLHGGPNIKGGWNSVEMQEKTDNSLIRKHGFKEWFLCRAGLEYPGLQAAKDDEGRIIRELVEGKNVLELGCANIKTVDYAVGVDVIAKGEPIPHYNGVSNADVQADAEKPMPFPDSSQDTIIARHLLEHCLDAIGTINNWKRYLKDNGKLVIAVPDEDKTSAISLNPEHLHAFNESSLKRLGETCGFKVLKCVKSDSMSLVMHFEKNGYK